MGARLGEALSEETRSASGRGGRLWTKVWVGGWVRQGAGDLEGGPFPACPSPSHVEGRGRACRLRWFRYEIEGIHHIQV